MASDRGFDKIHSQYRIALARAQDLQEQLNTKQKQWAEREEQFSITDKLARELCEDILAKDRNEMKLGTEYSWDSIPLHELLRKTKTVFQAYVNSKRDLLEKVMDESESRRMETDSLREQIRVMKRKSTDAADKKQEELAEAEQTEKTESPGNRSGAQKAAQKEHSIGDGSAQKVVIRMDEADELSGIEEDIVQAVADKEKNMRKGPKSPVISENQKRIRKKKEIKEKADAMHDVNIAEYEENMDGIQWEILRVIGTEGLSVYKEIENLLLRDNPGYVKSKIRVSEKLLESSGAVYSEKVAIPSGSCTVCTLTDMGERIYKRKYGKDPVLSEAEKVKKEHDNLHHGYGILYSADLLRNSGFFSEVCEYNRKNPVHLEGCSDYIPDIVCTDADGRKYYMEYECANHSQTSFNGKCQKMCQVTDTLNFIVQNREVEAELQSQVARWVENRGLQSLPHITVRITSARQMLGRDVREDSGWHYVYKLKNGTEPVVNF